MTMPLLQLLSSDTGDKAIEIAAADVFVLDVPTYRL